MLRNLRFWGVLGVFGSCFDIILTGLSDGRRLCNHRLNRRRQRRQANTLWRHLESSSDTTSPQSADVEPMQLGRLRLTVQQRQERLAQGLCLYCGKAGHFVLQCPLKVKAHQ